MALSFTTFAGHPTVGTSNFLLHHLCLNSADVLITKAGPVSFKGVVLDDEQGAELAVAYSVRVHDAPFAGRPYGGYPVVSIVNSMTAVMVRLPDLAALGRQTASLLGAENTYTAQECFDKG
ncbi:hypothetical protein GGR53DRAFT_461960 [Hypoxylon sp. FL1150]|nr:hypothetical protein GGR53DRAFT_461960 [Hypoxylon sp. FL1150]